MAEPTILATPVNQIFDNEYEEEDISDNVSQSSNMVPAPDGKIRGLGDGLPEAVDQLTSPTAVP